MKRVFCPKCDNQLAFDETKYPEGKVLAFVCPQCGSQFKIKLGRKIVRTESGQEKEVKEPDFSCGYITVIENVFGFKQELPLVMGDNVIGRRNKDTDGVDVPIITSDPSMGRKHCVINVKRTCRKERTGAGWRRRHCNDRCYHLYSSCTGRGGRVAFSI